MILKLKPTFGYGMDGVIREIEADPIRLKKYKEIRPAVNLLRTAAEQVLNGSYRYTENEERLYLSDGKYVKTTWLPPASRKLCGFLTFCSII